MRIGVDLMGSDRSPEDLGLAALDLAKVLDSRITLVLLVTQGVYASFPLSIEGGARVEWLEVAQSIQMAEAPLTAVRKKRQSSLLQGIQLLTEGRLDGLVSAGNTGALIAAAALFLPKLPGIERPALLAQVPTAKGKVTVVDVGGNVTWKSRHLVQFAAMGVAYQRCSQGQQNPRVGLLNVGVEAAKGHSEVREVYQQLEDLCRHRDGKIHFCGNIEGRDVFQGAVDVLVTDGFTGNVFLKTAEGVSSFILEQLHMHFSSLKEAPAQKAVRDFEQVISYSEAGGALVCGVEGVLVKCHGHSSGRALQNGIRNAISAVESGLVDKMRQELARCPQG